MSKLFKSKFLLGVLAVFAGFALASSANAAITMTLRQGMNNSQVKELQQTLNSKGFTVSTTGAGSVGSETNYFGSRTTAAVKSFQQASGLTVDGIFGPMSRAALGSSTGSTTGSTGTLCPNGMTLASNCTTAPSTSTPTEALCPNGMTLASNCTTAPGSSTSTGPLTASLAYTTPASGTLVQGQALADLAHFTFTGTGTLNSVVLKRTGISADSTLEDVFLFNGATRLTDSAAVSSGSLVTFSGLNLAVNGSMTISVRADIAGSTSGETIGIQLTSFNGNAVSLSGNTHTIASSTLAAVSVASATGSVTEPVADAHVWGATLTVSTRDVTFSRLALRQVGSIPSDEINNFKLLVDGVQVATAASLGANNYVTFDISPAVTLQTGSRVLKVMADVVGGSNRTVEFDLRGSYDLGVTDSQFMKGVEATGTFPFGPSASTVSAGSLSIVKATNSASGNITNAGNDVSFGTFTFTAYGEPVKVETLTVGFDLTGLTDAGVTVRNVRVMADGAQVGSTTSVAVTDAHGAGSDFTTNFVVNPGSPVTVEVRGDVYDSEGTQDFATDDTIQVGLLAGSSNAVRQESLGSFNAPSALTTGNVLTVKVGTLAMAKTSNYPNQSAIAPQTAYKIASYVLSGNSTEAVNVNTFDLDIAVTDNSGGATASIADVTDVYIKYGSNQTTIKSTVVASTNTWSPSFTLGVNETMLVDVYATFNSDFLATDTIVATLEVSGTTTQSASSQTTSTVAGQTITMAAASITASLDASSPVAQLVDDSGSVTTAVYKFVSVTDAYTITDVNVTLGSASAVSTVDLMDGGTVLASKPAATDLTFSGLSVAVPANSTKLLSVRLNLSPIGVGMGTTDSSLITTLDVSDTLARNSQGTSAAVSGSDAASNSMYAYKAVPVITALPLPSLTLTGGVQTIAKFSVSSNGTGTVAWKEVLLEINSAAAPTLASFTLWDVDTGSQVTAAALIQNADGASASAFAADTTTGEVVLTVGTKGDDDVVEQVSGTKTYEVRATVGGTLADGNFVATKIDRNTTSHAASAAFATNDAAATANSTSFTWSDESASATADTGVSTWQTDYLVKNLPVNWTLSR